MTYHSGGTSINGLTDGQTYYVRDTGDGQTFNLFNSYSDAENNQNPIAFTSAGGAGQSLNASADNRAGNEAGNSTGVVTVQQRARRRHRQLPHRWQRRPHHQHESRQCGDASRRRRRSTTMADPSDISAPENATPTPPGTSAIVESGATWRRARSASTPTSSTPSPSTAVKAAGGFVGAGGTFTLVAVADNVTAFADGTLGAGGRTSASTRTSTSR